MPVAVLIFVFFAGGCMKTDDSRFATDVYWFRTATQTVDVDTSLRVPVEQPIYVFRLGGVEYAVDTLAFEVLPEYTTAIDPDNYQIINSVVRFVTADTLRSEIVLKIYPETLLKPDTVALKLLYAHPANTGNNRRHDRIRVILNPVRPPEPDPDPEPEEPEQPENPDNPDNPDNPENPDTPDNPDDSGTTETPTE